MGRTLGKILGMAASVAGLFLLPATAAAAQSWQNVSSASAPSRNAPVPEAAALARGVKYGTGAPMGWSITSADTSSTRSGPRVRSLASTMSTATSSSTLTPGIDVSAYATSTINWSALVANGKKFAFLKATEGTYYTSDGDPNDPMWFTTQWARATSAGILRGAYHFANPGATNPGGAAQADFFMAHGGGWSPDGQTLPGVLDIETNPYTGGECYGLTQTQMVSWIQAFSNEYHLKTGVYPIIYTGPSWWNTCTGGSAAFDATNPFWIAGYYYSGNSTLGPPSMPAGVGLWTFWQYNDANGGTVPGTDYDQFNGDLCQLQRFTKLPGASTSNAGGYKPGSVVGVGSGANSVQQIYIVDASGCFKTEWQTSPNGRWSSWTLWGSGYAPGTPIGVGEAPQNIQQVYFVDANGHLQTRWQTGPGAGWSRWTDWGGGYPKGAPVGVGRSPAGEQQIYLVNAAGHLLTKWQTQPGGHWSAWSDWGGGYAPNAPVGVGFGPLGVQQIYLVDASGHLQTKWQTQPGGHWSAWLDWGGGYAAGTAVTVGENPNYVQEIYYVDSNGHIQTKIQDGPGGLWSTGWVDIGSGYTPSSSVGVGQSASGAQQLFVVNTNGQLVTNWQTSPGGAWTGWQAWMN